MMAICVELADAAAGIETAPAAASVAPMAIVAQRRAVRRRGSVGMVG